MMHFQHNALFFVAFCFLLANYFLNLFKRVLQKRNLCNSGLQVLEKGKIRVTARVNKEN